jgi:ribosomal peptide maturation radical SAM protein 1
MARIVLVQMPFYSLCRPSISLSLLRGVLEKDGHETEIRYLNIDYARRVGVNLYQAISDVLATDMLYGEMAFSAVPLGAGDDPEAEEAATRHMESQSIPSWLVRALPHLASEARNLVLTESLAIARGGFDLAGFSTTFNLAPALAMAKQLKSIGAGPPVALGGASVEGVMGEAVIRLFSAVDYVCTGEGENAVLSLARHIDAGDEDGALIPGIISRTWPKASRPASWQNLDELPVPQYDDWLAQLAAADIDLPKSQMIIPIETSRGCWYGAQQHCTFCGLNGESLAFRRKSPAIVIRDIDEALRYGITNIHAVDNILDLRFFRSVLPELARRRHGATLFYEIKSKTTRDQVQLMAQAGIRMVQPGIESLSTPILKLMRKGVDAYHNIRLLRWCEELGILPGWNILYGFPRENKRDYLDMLRILPLLYHLPPPHTCHVQLHRFSPLDFDGPALGVARRWPAEPSRYIYGVPDSELSDLVYYFEFEADDGNDSEEYAGPLKRSVQDWQASYPASALVRADTDTGCWVFDTRPIASTNRTRLAKPELDVLKNADRGIRRADLEAGAGAETLAAISKLIDLGWLLPVDGRLLSLVVDHTPLVPWSLPEEFLEPFCLELAAHQHLGSPFEAQIIKAAQADALSLASPAPVG